VGSLDFLSDFIPGNNILGDDEAKKKKRGANG